MSDFSIEGVLEVAVAQFSAEVVLDITEFSVSVVLETGPAGARGPTGPAGASKQHERLEGVQNSANVVFAASSAISPGTEWVRVNGIPQTAPDHYQITGPSEITFAYPPKEWWVLEIEYQEA